MRDKRTGIGRNVPYVIEDALYLAGNEKAKGILIMQEYSHEDAEKFVNLISAKY